MISSKKIAKGQLELDHKLDKSGYTGISLPVLNTDELLINRGGVWYKVDKSELGGGALGYTPENEANKVTTVTGNETSNTVYGSVKAIVDWVTSLFVPKTRSININGTSQNLSTDITFTIPTDDFLQSKWKTFDLDNALLGFATGAGINGGGIILGLDSQPPEVRDDLDTYTTQAVILQSVATANSGYSAIVNTAEQAFEGFTMFAIMRPLELTNSVTRYGIFSSGQQNPNNSFTSGLMFEINNGVLLMKTGNGTTQSSSSSYTIPNTTTFLYIMIEVELNNASQKQVRIKVKDSFNSSSYLLNTTVTSNLPVNSVFSSYSDTRFGFGSKRTAATASLISQWGYIGYGVKKPNFLNSF